jgi:hypothetical protein
VEGVPLRINPPDDFIHGTGKAAGFFAEFVHALARKPGEPPPHIESNTFRFRKTRQFAKIAAKAACPPPAIPRAHGRQPSGARQVHILRASSRFPAKCTFNPRPKLAQISVTFCRANASLIRNLRRYWITARRNLANQE